MFIDVHIYIYNSSILKNTSILINNHTFPHWRWAWIHLVKSPCFLPEQFVNKHRNNPVCILPTPLCLVLHGPEGTGSGPQPVAMATARQPRPSSEVGQKGVEHGKRTPRRPPSHLPPPGRSHRRSRSHDPQPLWAEPWIGFPSLLLLAGVGEAERGGSHLYLRKARR